MFPMNIGAKKSYKTAPPQTSAIVAGLVDVDLVRTVPPKHPAPPTTTPQAQFRHQNMLHDIHLPDHHRPEDEDYRFHVRDGRLHGDYRTH
jgi:hypothetical protein